MIKYVKFDICEGCGQCVKTLPNGQAFKQEHVLSNQDVTLAIKTALMTPPVDSTITDVKDKNEASIITE